MNSGQKNKFSASAPALGYLYQCRFALWYALERLWKSEKFRVSLETLDDVVFEGDGMPKELIQMKHHMGRSADLSDSSPDIWKSVRIWSEELKGGTVQEGDLLFLVTTSQAASGSAAEYLGQDGIRDTGKALERLKSVASTSSSTSNKLAYEAFRALADHQQRFLIDSIFVVSGAPTIDDMEAKLKESLHPAVRTKHLKTFLDYFEGWWFRRCIKHLTRQDRKPILSEDLDGELAILRQQFTENDLPIDEEILGATIDDAIYQDQTFVHQLRLIEITNQRIFIAVRDYYRALMHRSRWVREELIEVGELTRYERQLIENWEIHFEQMRQKCGESVAEEKKKEAAREIYAIIEASRNPIRPYVTENSISRGTYQILANDLKVGWHPEFKERIRALLEPQESD